MPVVSAEDRTAKLTHAVLMQLIPVIYWYIVLLAHCLASFTIKFQLTVCTHSNVTCKQESCAIAKMTAQCAIYMGALKIFGTP